MVILSLQSVQKLVEGWGWPLGHCLPAPLLSKSTVGVQIPAVGHGTSHLARLKIIFFSYQVGLLTAFSVVELYELYTQIQHLAENLG